jgi:hypothetical protein
MLFDVRLPIGLLFLGIGVLVTGAGLLGDPAVFRAHSAGLNIDVAWGLVMGGFGVVMLMLAALAKRKPPTPDSEA